MSKVVLVTGGSRGIGRQVVRLLAERGDRVVFTYRQDRERAEEVVNSARELGSEALALEADVTAERDVLYAFEEAKRRFGNVSGVVNNAGIVAPSKPLAEMDVERIRRVIAVNLFGALLVARQAVRVMSNAGAGKGGSLVNVSSAASKHGSPFEYVDYAATKGALDTLTLGLAKEVASVGIRVNAVRPGLIDTEIHGIVGNPNRAFDLGKTTPMGRPGTAREVAEAIVWLLSDAASYVVGALLDVAGGR